MSIIQQIRKSPNKEISVNVANEHGLNSIQRDQLVALMALRFPAVHDKRYIGEWADRIKKGYAYNTGDKETRKIWLKLIKSPETYNY